MVSISRRQEIFGSREARELEQAATFPPGGVKSAAGAWARGATIGASPALRTLLLAILVGATYYLAQLLASLLRFPPTRLTTVWLPGAILITALLLAPPRQWWLYVLICIAAQYSGYASGGWVGPGMLINSIGICAVTTMTAFFLRRFVKGPPFLGDLRSITLFMLIGIGGILLGSLISAVNVVFTGYRADLWTVWRSFAIGAALGSVLLAPLLLRLFTGGWQETRAASPWRYGEAAALFGCLLAASHFAYGGWRIGPGLWPALIFMPFPFLVWAAFRFGLGGACASALGLAFVSTANAVHGHGPFSTLSPATNVLSLQSFLIFAVFPLMLLAVLIEERHRDEGRLRGTEERQRALLENITDVIHVLDPGGITRYVSPSARQVLGYAPEELLGTNAFDLVHPDDKPAITMLLEENLQREDAVRSAEFRYRHKNGSWRVLEAVGNNQLHRPGVHGIVITLRDITERRESEEQTRRQAYYDTLTELPNRVLCRDRLAQLLSVARRHDDKIVVLALDLDDFKQVNDSLGHAFGDRVLQEVANRLSGLLRDEDTVARMGGDEFTVLLPDTDADGAVVVCEKLLEQFGKPLRVDDQELYTTPSIGISLFPMDGDNAEELLKNADAAMYRGKAASRGGYTLYQEAMNAAAHERLLLSNGLRGAIERSELRLYYQPQVDLRTGRLVGVEALIRWEHPDLGLISPVRFIPLAEETGMIVPVGEWVLREACRQAAAWRSAGYAIRIAVNLSPRQFTQRQLVETIGSVLRDAQLDGAALELEVTEGALTENAELAREALRNLKALGTRIAVDDFGTGHSSLSRLRDFELDAIKIDRSFLSEMREGAQDRAIVGAVIELAHALDLEVVAEGVETEAQQESLRALNCDLIQGFLVSRPVPAANVTALLSAYEPAPD